MYLKLGLQIAEYQEASTANRRKLADATRDFKRGTQSDTSSSAKAVGALLRQYQEEIDALTKRAKFGEGAFLELYQQLYEVGADEDSC
jgi:homeobox protein cut-like